MESPPVITPHQMNLLRAVTAMAWSDGVLEPAEIETMATQLSQQFVSDPAQQDSLAQSIREYFSQQIPLDEVLPQLKTEADRRLVLKLGYLVIAASAREPGEPLVNVDELEAFQHLVTSLALPAAVVHVVSEEAKTQLQNPEVAPIDALVQGFTDHYIS